METIRDDYRETKPDGFDSNGSTLKVWPPSSFKVTETQEEIHARLGQGEIMEKIKAEKNGKQLSEQSGNIQPANIKTEVQRILCGWQWFTSNATTGKLNCGTLPLSALDTIMETVLSGQPQLKDKVMESLRLHVYIK